MQQIPYFILEGFCENKKKKTKKKYFAVSDLSSLKKYNAVKLFHNNW